MGIPSVDESIVSIFTSLSFLDSLPFHRTTSRLASAALAPLVVFEGQHIREAEEYELGLFQLEQRDDDDSGRALSAGRAGRARTEGASADAVASQDRDGLRKSIVGRGVQAQTQANTSGAQGIWAVSKRRAPARIRGPEVATPLKRLRVRHSHASGKDKGAANDDPEAYLLAARKLLQHYSGPGLSMTRANEHVNLLYSQYEGLVDAIADLEEALEAAPQGRTSPIVPVQDARNSMADELAELEAEIRREELEILALKELRAEREREARALDAASHATSVQPLSRQNRFRTASTTQSEPQLSSGGPRTQPRAAPALSHRVAAVSKSTVPGVAPPVPAGLPGRRVPAVVAKRMADAQAPAGAGSVVADAPTGMPMITFSSPTAASAVAKDDVLVEPAGTAPEISQTDPAPVTLTKQATPKAAEPYADPSSDDMELAVPPHQLAGVLAKIAAVSPARGGLDTSDALSVLTRLERLSSEAALLSGSASPSSTALMPVQQVELHLLAIYLSLLLGRPHASLSLVPKVPATSTTNVPEPMLPLTALKTALGQFASERGWSGDLGTKAVYGLVAKRVVRIDRASKETMIGFTLSL